MSRLKLEVQYIECANGWQAEVAINVTWTAYTKIFPTKEDCQKEFAKLADLLGCHNGG